ncbi:MAG: DUF3160 domain-containing protein [Deltaproteobacteria bacterium]
MLRKNAFRTTRPGLLLVSSLIALACGTDAGTQSTPRGTPEGPSQAVTARDEIPQALEQALSAAAALDGSGLQRVYPTPTATALAQDLTQAAGMDLIQGSALALNASELETLAADGLVISARKEFPSFAYGYKTIYGQDLPLYVSADSILEAVHRSFDSFLAQTEEQVLFDELSPLLEGMRTNLKSAALPSEVAVDLDLYLALAASLLKGQLVAPVAGASADEIGKLFQLARAGSGHRGVKLFGVARDEDFSQFTPRGHYADSERLSAYFKAMMWLGRVDLRMIETQGDGSQVFYRRQFDAAVALNQLLAAPERQLWDHIDSTIGAFAGEHDSMTPKDMIGLLEALLVTSVADSAALTDEQIVAEIARGGWGAQRIASRIIIKDKDGPTLPLDRSFLLFGQRYTVDSHTFVNVTYDRVAGRLMPEPLDVAFAALGNNAALPLLSDEFDNASYVAGLAKTRTLVDAHESSYWEGSLYTRWLGALRSLSPQSGVALANIVPTEAWQKRILSAQLGSWAELRHDTILYVKQSYTGGISCDFPDAYVDPYPEFYARMGAFADAAAGVATSLPDRSNKLKAALGGWAANFRAVMGNLRTMAENQLSGAPHSPELLGFINDAVKWDEQNVCGGVVFTNLAGWYLKLYLDAASGLTYDPVVADVHTQPTDAVGRDVGRILHVGTGQPRMMVVTANTCQGPRAYVGLAFSYGELVTEDWKRLNDEDWLGQLASKPFPDAPWLEDVVAH